MRYQMPFINDQLNHNNEQLKHRKYQQNIARESRFKFNPEQVAAALRNRIVGQTDVIDALRDMLFTLKADFGDKNRPLSVMLFMGPTGVGKTETVRILAELILGHADRLCRIDMNTLAQEHYSAALTGSPPGYVGSKEGQTLFDIEKIKGSFSEPGIVLFDEVEKADQSVVRSLMNILDTGKLTLTSGMSEIDFSNTLIFMTSNLGAQEQSKVLKNYSQGWKSLLKLKPPSQIDLLDQALNAHFDPEFINRIDRMLPFDLLDGSQLGLLLDLELSKLNKRLRTRHAKVTANTKARKYLSKAYDKRYGARDIARRIRIDLEPKLAQEMLLQPEKLEFEVTIEEGELKVL
jgi:ATP-dependent Clp protease ATP-binding subunit ClpA